MAPAPVAGWANAGDGYSTHDWVIDQAVKVLDGKAGWFDAAAARLVSDDPDVERNDIANEHVYRGEGRRGGGVDRIAMHFDNARAALVAGDEHEASVQIGLMAHFVADLGMPYHTHTAGTNLDDRHRDFERLVGSQQRTKSATPEWQSSRRTVSTVGNVRDVAIGTARYSRQYFHELNDLLKADGMRLTNRVSTIVGLVMKRSINDLADLIWSIDRGEGEQPQIGAIALTVRWTGVKAGDQNTAWVRATDVGGDPIEGLKVLLRWPTPTGTHLEYLYTDEDGKAKRHASVGTTPKLELRTVKATATVRGIQTVSTHGWTISPRLADGRAGFKTVVSDATVVAGQVVRVTSTARDANGRGIPDLLVTWTWDYNGSRVKTKAYTDGNGKASSSRTIADTTTRTTVSVSAATQAGSTNRSSSTSFRRVD